MKAVRYHSYGGSDVLAYEEADRPAAGPGQVVVKVAGSLRNPVDVADPRRLSCSRVFPVALPHIPNFDVSGVIDRGRRGRERAGAPGTRLRHSCRWTVPRRGRRVRDRAGDWPAAAPRTVELADAAGRPSASLTASQALFEHAGCEAGDERPDQRSRGRGRPVRRPAG